MNALFPIVEQLVINGLLSKKAPLMRKSKFGLGLAILSGLLFLITIIFALIGAYGWLLQEFSQPVAALLVCAGVLALSVIAGLSGYALLTKKPAVPADHSEDITTLIAEMTAFLGEELAEPIQENPKTALLLAGLAGYVAGDRLH